jgi:3-hydroxybutyrate dehydrogenase
MTEEEVIKNVMLGRQAVKEFIPVETIGKLAVFLASPEAATLTGAALPIDGGWNCY